ncbi:DUF2069 domain-containing protein [Hydrogenophilus thiooxidans]|uniref:DUF2069 domain-containing protein n=1 Tax=Hydrogenophilus thiooxidans TaxID=2820326 RepID=UPI001C246579|nr:DUF2069 domain-containing protein [Hydrogenophilus thiooxidans]
MARRWAAMATLLAFLLAVWAVAWESVVAPIRPGGSWLVLKAVPLALLLPGLWRGRLRTYQWAALWCSFYLLEGSARLFDPAPVRWLAVGEAALALLLFAAVVRYVRFFPRRQRHASPTPED